MDHFKKVASSRHSNVDTHMNSQRLPQHAQGLHIFKSEKGPSLKQGSGHELSPLTICNPYLFSLLQQDVTGYINHYPGQAPCPGEVTQHNKNSVVVLILFVFFYECVCFLFHFGIYYLIGLLLVYFEFCFQGFLFCFPFGLFYVFVLIGLLLKRNTKYTEEKRETDGGIERTQVGWVGRIQEEVGQRKYLQMYFVKNTVFRKFVKIENHKEMVVNICQQLKYIV